MDADRSMASSAEGAMSRGGGGRLPGPPVEGRLAGRWHPETFVCAFRGHLAPAVNARRLDESDWLVGVETAGGGHLGRCLRCDAWVLADPAKANRDDVGDLSGMAMPERGKKLRDSLVLKLIAVNRGIHAIVFGLLAVGLFFLRNRLGGLQDQARALVRNAGGGLAGTGQDTSRTFLLKSLNRLVGLDPKTLGILFLTSVAYCLIEGVEAVGLWRGRRWAEYLTAIATAGFLPFEVDELVKRVTVGRVFALVINLAVLGYLVWGKRLFGLRGGAQEDDDELSSAERLPVLPGQVAPGTSGDGPAART